MECGSDPAIVIDGAVAEDREVLRVLTAIGVRVLERVDQACTIHRHLRNTLHYNDLPLQGEANSGNSVSGVSGFEEAVDPEDRESGNGAGKQVDAHVTDAEVQRQSQGD